MIFKNIYILIIFYIALKKKILVSFRKRGREGERGELLAQPQLGTWPHGPGVCPDQELNQEPFGSQVGTQSTELHQPGQNICVFIS